MSDPHGTRGNIGHCLESHDLAASKLHANRPLMDALCQEFGGRDWVSITAVEDFVMSDRVEYHGGHTRKALKPMEQSGRIETKDGTRKRKGTYPEGTLIRFKCDK